MSNQKGFAPLLVLGLVVILVIAGAGTVVYRHSMQNSQQTNTTVAKPSAVAAKKSAANAKLATATLPDGWHLWQTRGLQPNFAYPKEYGEFMSPAKGGGKYIFNGWESSEPITAPVAGMSGKFYLTEYTDAAPVVSAGKYQPDVQLRNDQWAVVALNGADSGEYKVQNTYNKIVATTNADGVKVYVQQGGDEGVVSYMLYFIADGHMYSLALPKEDLGNYGASDTTNSAGIAKVRQGAYDHFERSVLDSITVK